MAASSTSTSRAKPGFCTVPSVPTLTGHYRAGDDLHTVFMGSRDVVLNTPPPQDARCPEPWDRNPDFSTPTYISPLYPYLVFIPKLNPWHGLLLGILDYTFHNLPIVQQEDGMWSLDRAVVQEWSDFEDCLRGVGREMLWLSSKPFPKHISSWFIPTRYKYILYYKTEKGARLAAWRCRSKFLPLLGLVSMGFWFMIHEEMEEEEAVAGVALGSKRKAQNVPELRSVKRVRTGKLGGGRPEHQNEGHIPWRQALSEKLNIHASWIDVLEMSVATDWTAPRVGGLIDLCSDDFDHMSTGPEWRTGLEWLFYSILSSGCPIPLYFTWGPVPQYINYAVPEYLQHLGLVPDKAEIDYIVRLPGHVAFSPLLQDDRGFYPYRSPSPPAPAPATAEPGFFSTPPTSAPAEPVLSSPDDREDVPPDFPPVHRFSGQRSGERMEDYFARRAKDNLRRLAKETPGDRTARLQREENAKRGRAPEKKGARVYVWENEGNGKGFYIRRPGGRNKYAVLFEDYPSSQRRYDSFNDEWDLCSVFGDDESSNDENADEDDDDDDDDEYGCRVPNVDMPAGDDEPDPILLVNVGPASERNLSRMYLHFGPGSSEAADPGYLAIAGDVHTALYKRFGFVMGQSRKTPSCTPEMSIVASLVGLQDINMGFVDVMAIFFGQFLEAKSSGDLDREIFDFHQRDHSPLFQPWPFIVRRESLTNTVDKSVAVYYVLCDHNSGLGSESLLLLQAADVLEIIRQGWGPCVKDVAKQLLLRGIPFRIAVMESVNLMRQREAVVPGRRRPAVNVNSGLGYRAENYQPTIHDYHAYLTQLNSQLLHTRRGRVAPPYGGVIGRIARSEVSDEHVLRGPSDDVYDTGVCLWDGRSDHAYWHESLTEHEMDLICGVYYVATGKKIEAGVEQTKLLSWWPKLNAWRKGNLDPGWWSPECEGWFRKRLGRLEDSQRYGEKGMLARPNEWKHNLRFVKSLKDYVQAYERVAASILYELCTA
ncbi:hypothetical protein MVEN_02339800 [Mycena venus]|uniref:Uncharacterized protein n=1 Tax=Mycena venus TaxID=2733690 RepID=A0A8H6X4F4_9AGAR|nr:hypothetical protein MVEN_02339800 [Mycena venus]